MRIKTMWIKRNSELRMPAELLVAWDEYSVDENPEGFQKDVSRALEAVGDDVESHRFVDVLVPDLEIEAAFSNRQVAGRVDFDS